MVTLGAGQLIKGFDQGLVGMKVGGRRRLVIPGSLAYGTAGQPPDDRQQRHPAVRRGPSQVGQSFPPSSTTGNSTPSD